VGGGYAKHALNSQPKLNFLILYISVGNRDSFLTKNKKGLNPVWNETFESAVDRDEFLNIKIWDEKKLADYEDSSPKPVGKVCRSMNIMNMFWFSQLVYSLQRLKSTSKT
jgi:hypothetical protein